MKKQLFSLALMLVAFTSNAQTYSYDVNHDGEIDISDVVCLVNKILGSFNPGEDILCPDSNHPHMIDLDLPSGTKWACCNVGTETPEGYGEHYSWSETIIKDYYDWNAYTHCDGTKETCHNLGGDIAGTEYDVAHVKWGGSWVMPSSDQQKELLINCTYIWTTMNGIKGRKFIGKNGGSIFLPAAGIHSPNLKHNGTHGFYWSSTLHDRFNYGAFILYFDSSSTYCDGYEYQSEGCNVRPVWVEKQTTP